MWTNMGVNPKMVGKPNNHGGFPILKMIILGSLNVLRVPPFKETPI